MVESIFLEGGEYISASRASQKIGYAVDYIGQLCRAKKIPGQLVGRTWYVDFASLVEHKKNRKLGKRKKISDLENSALAPTDSENFRALPASGGLRHDENFLNPPPPTLPRFSNNPVFTYENDDRPRLPELSKKGRFIKSPWNIQTVKEAVSLSLAVLVTAGVGLMTLERAAPPIAADFEQRVESISIAGEKFFAALPAEFIQTQQLATANAGQITASLFDGVNEFVGDFVSGFRYFKDIALSKIFLTPAVPQAKIPSVVVAENINGSKAVTEVSGQLSLETLKSELKTELENYVRVQIDSAGSPVVVYSSSPALALAELASFKTNEVAPAIYYSVTRQSNADSSRSSSHIAHLTDGGSFSSATIKGATIYDSTGGFSTLAFTTATGTSATTTNFFATNAEFTNLISTGQTITNLTFTIATGTSATTTNLYVSGRASTTDLRANTSFLGNLTSTFATFANALFNGSSTLQNFTAQNSTSTQATTTNFAISGLTLGSIPFVGTSGAIIQNNSNLFWDNTNARLGIGTTTPQWKTQISGTAAPQLTLSDSGLATANHWTFRNSNGTLYFATSSPTSFATSTTPALTIDGTTGNVGIGTASPGSKLDVIGDNNGLLRVRHDGGSINGSSPYIGFYGGAGAGATTRVGFVGKTNQISGDFHIRNEVAGGAISLGTASGNDKIYLLDNGNLGIGTTTPFTLLQVATTSISSTFKSQFTLTDNGGGTNAKHWNLTSVGGDFRIGTSSDAYATSTYLTIKNGGNVGIGTVNPLTDLHLRNRTVLEGVVNNQTLLGNNVYYDGANWRYIETAAASAVRLGASTGEISFYTLASGTGGTTISTMDTTAVKMLLDVNGQLGIGDVTPAALFVVGDGDLFRVDSSGRVLLPAGASGAGNLALSFTADTDSGLYRSAADEIRVQTGGSDRITINTSGNVGIGQTNPQQKLTVAGSVGLQGIDTGAGTAYLCTTLATGVVSTSTSACNGSSLRYKENVKDMTYGLSDVLKLRPVSFNYKPEILVYGHQVGFLAEDVYEIVPEVVGFDKEGRPDNIDYAKLTSVLTRGVQELNLNVEAIASTTANSTLESQSFATSFFRNLFARVTAWLASAGNGIENIFARAISTEIVYTKELCIDDICITKTELKALLELANTPAQADTSPSSGSSQLPAPEPTSELTPEIAPTEEPVTVVEPEPVTEEPAAQEFEEPSVETITAEPTSEITPAPTVGSVNP